MPSKKRPNNRPNSANRPKQRGAAAKASQTQFGGIQIAAIVVIVLVAAVIVYLVATSQKPAANSANPAATQPAAAQAAATQPAAAQVVAPTVMHLSYNAAPPMTIDKSKQYTATVKMAKGGEFVIQLYADKAPITVNSFVFLARQGFYNGVTFHRVLQGFMAQGGDPTGTGGGGPGYQFVNENSDLTFDKAGVVAMANAGPDTNGSQFFITFGPQPNLNGGYTIFGQVVSGMDVVNAIRLRNPDDAPNFTGDAMASVTITEK